MVEGLVIDNKTKLVSDLLSSFVDIECFARPWRIGWFNEAILLELVNFFKGL